MKKTTILTILTFLPLAIFTQENAYCQGAFKTFEWGEVFEVVRSSETTNPTRELKNTLLTYNVMLLDKQFELVYLFKSGFLHSVTYTAEFDYDYNIAVKIFYELNDIFLEKYGQPWSKMEEFGQSKKRDLKLAIYDEGLCFNYFFEYIKGDVSLCIKSRSEYSDKVTIYILYSPSDIEAAKIQKLSNKELSKIL